MRDINPEVGKLFDKLHQIQQLWVEIGQTKKNDPKYEILTKKIRVLSAEYQALVDAIKEP